jgi:selenophosphate synthetase-related protein
LSKKTGVVAGVAVAVAGGSADRQVDAVQAELLQADQELIQDLRQQAFGLADMDLSHTLADPF